MEQEAQIMDRLSETIAEWIELMREQGESDAAIRRHVRELVEREFGNCGVGE